MALLAAALGEPHTTALAWAATALAILTSALDGVDGWLARRSTLASAFGARFDMETDALLIMVLSALAWRWDRAGAWVLACGLMRYAFVAAGRRVAVAGPAAAAQRAAQVRGGRADGRAGDHRSAGRQAAAQRVAGRGHPGDPLWSFAIDILWLAPRHRRDRRSTHGQSVRRSAP